MAPLIHFDYDFSPYGQKTKLVLQAAGVTFQKCDQPPALPRPDLEELGITYRRIPLLAIGKDIYCDSNRIISIVLEKLGKLRHGPTDPAYAVWGDECFSEILGLIPQQVLTPEFLKDRESIFPFLLRPDLKSLRPSTIAQFHSRLRQVEHGFLSGQGPFLHGSEISVADIHLIWPIRWAIKNLGLGEEPSFSESAYPRIWRLIESLPEPKPQVLSPEETHSAIRGSEYTAQGPTTVPSDDAYGLAAGSDVTVESFDSTPGANPQAGKLVGTTVDEVVIEIKDGIRLHFPRIGYIVRAKGTTW